MIFAGLKYLNTTTSEMLCRGELQKLTKPISLRFLIAISQKTVWSLEDFCLLVYESSVHASSYDHVRVQAKRFNQTFVEIIGFNPVLSVTKRAIHFDSRLRVILRAEPLGSSQKSQN
jgi:hypothetical protein